MLKTTLGLAVALAWAPSMSFAQQTDTDELGCGTVCWDACCVFGYHQYDLNPGAGNHTGYDSHACQRVGAHGTCFYAPKYDEDARLAYLSVIQAARRGKTEEILRAALRVPDYVIVNTDRGTIMVLSCSGGGYVANVHYAAAPRITQLASALDAIQKRRLPATPLAGAEWYTR